MVKTLVDVALHKLAFLQTFKTKDDINRLEKIYMKLETKKLYVLHCDWPIALNANIE